LLVMLLLKPRDHVSVEEPGNVEARQACISAGSRIVGGRVDEQGLRVPEEKVTLIYTAPSRQFPTGVSMSLQRRLALLDYAVQNRAWIIEDDYDSELRYGA